MTEAPASHHEVQYWVCDRGASLIVNQERQGEAVLVLKSRRVIPVMATDVQVLVDRGWQRHLIHFSPPKEAS